ncbi:MAG: biopolymer transporter ExbD [Planctomycetes bacterium]|nr:biopolymer transporter ExbD [Planctomycetota bacterium]
MAEPKVNSNGQADLAVHYVSERKKRGLPRPRMALPLTPMIDVTFQLLLFFILTMQFRPPEGQIPANLPADQGSSGPAVTPLEPIRVRLRAAPQADQAVQIEIDRYDIVLAGWGQLEAALAELQSQFGSAEVPVVIEPGPKVRWSDALNAYRQAQRARFENIAFSRG